MHRKRVAIICNSFPTKKNRMNQIFVKNLADISNDSIYRVQVFYNPIFNFWGNANTKKGVFSNMLKYSFFLIGQLKLLLKIKSFDLLNPHGVIISGFVATIYKKIFKLPVVLHIHGGDLDLLPNSNYIFKYIYNFTVDNSDFIFVNSDNIKDKLLKFTYVTSSKVMTLSPGINYNTFFEIEDSKKLIQSKNKYSIRKDKLVLLFSGNAIKRKGLDILVSSLKLSEKVVLDKIHLIVCSNGPELEANKKIIKKVLHKNSITFLDKVKQDELNILYNISDWFIFPSREEPLGLVGIESIATGTPVIGSDVGGIKEYIDKTNGFLFNPDQPKQLTDLILKIFSNHIKGKSIKYNFIKKFKNHDILYSKKLYLNKITELINLNKEYS